MVTASPIVSDREWNAHILAQVASGKMTPEAAAAQLKTAPRGNGNSLSCKVSEKGALSVYGLQRMANGAAAAAAMQDFAAAGIGVCV